jgi:hypothetical protein
MQQSTRTTFKYVLAVALMNVTMQKLLTHYFKIKDSIINILLDYYLIIVCSKDL